MSVVAVGERPTINTDYTLNLEQARKGTLAHFLMSNSGGYMLDGIIETSKRIKKRASSHPVIVAVMTAGPELTDRPYQSVLETAERPGAALQMVVGTSALRQSDGMRWWSMWARDTGGATTRCSPAPASRRV